MKFKFRADAKDIKIFVGFCFLLLYFCAIGVLNAHSLATSGKFYGILPFEAFSFRYLGTTLTLFFLVLIGVCFSVSSYFFDREKGLGITTQKKDKGYSRWCKDKEMKATLFEVDPSADKVDHAGIVVVNDGKKLWVDDGEAHSLIIGATGSGKTQCVVFPMIKVLAKAGESMVLTDPKGELYENTSELLREKGYNIIVLNFRDPQKGNAWNPMTLPYRLYQEGNTDKAVELLDDLALNILYDEKNSGDPFWEKSGADYFSGLALGLFEDATEEQVNLNSMNLMSNLGEERFGGPNNNYIKEYFNMKDPARPAYVNASGTVYAPEETKGGVLSTFKQKVKLFSSRDNLSEMLSYSDFDMKDIGRKKTVVFMIVQDEKKTLHPLATIFIKQCYETLIDVAQEAGGHLPFRTNFLLDEFANMPPLKDVTTMVTAARSRHIRFNFIIQNFAQLTKVYGKEDAETIKGNCNILYLISSELQALEELSKMCGEVKSKEKEKTSSTPLVTVSDLQRMSTGEVIWLRLRMMPFKTKLAYDWQMNNSGAWGKNYDRAGYPDREKKEVQLFDIREFVKAKKKEKMEQMMNGNGTPMGGMSGIGGSPFGGMPGMGGSPFGGGSLPFGGMSGMGSSPFGGANSPFSGGGLDSLLGGSSSDKKENETFNVDDLVKKIDAKIAELEEEERKEQEEAQNKDKKIIDAEVHNKDDKALYEDGTFSDDFFDDFFSDDLDK
ncbi:MAG: type IV secretory system conjugative DNA transfer family protein [Erysipelotrichaceae bacterium]|nr:type IV secretory system conjugative DNA transfer family protein [Erysipelotrichaceae bacterium]